MNKYFFRAKRAIRRWLSRTFDHADFRIGFYEGSAISFFLGICAAAFLNLTVIMFICWLGLVMSAVFLFLDGE